MAITYDKIASTTLSSATGTISFTSIVSSYTDLRIVMTGKMVSAEQPYLKINSDTGNNYNYCTLSASSTTAGTSRTGTTSRIYIAPLVNWSITNAQLAEIDIFSYAGSRFKSILCAGSNDNIGAGGLDRTFGMWRSTAAITQIDIIGNTQDFAVGFTATLYGILKA